MRKEAEQIRVKLFTVSDRTHTGEREDRSGPVAELLLAEAGFAVSGPVVIPDGRKSVETALTEAIADGGDVILTLGGTGAGPRDETPEGTKPLIELDLPGVAEGLRANGAEQVPTAVLSRGVAGISRASADGHRLVLINLPGSTGGASDGVRYLAGILPHLIDQIRGGDH